jgi:hypothetical protein
MKMAIERGWLVMQESGTSVKFTQPVQSCSREGALSPTGVPR